VILRAVRGRSGKPNFSLHESHRRVDVDVTHRDLAYELEVGAKCRLSGDAIVSLCSP